MPGQDDHKETRTKAGKGIAASDKHGDAGMRASSPMDDGSQEMAEQDADENDDKQSKGLADLMQKGGMHLLCIHGQSGSQCIFVASGRLIVHVSQTMQRRCGMM